MTLRLALKELRTAKGLTQAELARAVGVRQATINDLEHGHTRQRTLEILGRLCDALQCAPGDLIVRTGRSRNRLA